MCRRSLAAAVGAIGLVAVVGVPASSLASKPNRHAYSETLLGKAIIVRGASFTNVYKVESSVNGTGAAVQLGKVIGHLAPLAGSSTTTIYFASGVSITTETFLLLPTANATIFRISGHGNCADGTRVHKTERCSYTFKGTLDTKTTLTKVKVTGTTTL